MAWPSATDCDRAAAEDLSACAAPEPRSSVPTDSSRGNGSAVYTKANSMRKSRKPPLR